jgi:acyl-CoA thioesterase-1
MLLRITTVLLTTLGAYIPLGLMTGYGDYKGPAKHPPKEYLARGRQPSTRVLVVSAGDSLTQGTFSADYVGLLRTKLNGKGYEFVNAGVNGEMSQELLARVQEIIACKPDVITILIGTNDVHDLIRTNIHDPSNPRASLALYRRNLEQIILQIQSETQARVAVLSIPPLGEDLESPANIILRRYNDSVREIAPGDRWPTCLLTRA